MIFQVIIHHTPKNSSVCAVFTKHDDAIMFVDHCKKYDSDNNVNWQYSVNELDEQAVSGAVISMTHLLLHQIKFATHQRLLHSFAQ